MATKSRKRVRQNGANEVWYKLPSGSWTCVGLVNKGYVVPIDERTYSKTPLAGAVIVKIEGERECGFEGQPAQTGKDEMLLLDVLNGVNGELYVYDGIVDGKHQEYYFKEVEFELSSRKKEGDLQVLELKCNAVKQDTAVSVVDTALPSIKKAAAGTTTGTNNYYVIIETTVS